LVNIRSDLYGKNLLLPENEVCRFVGEVPFKIGSKPPKFLRSSSYFEEFCIKLNDINVFKKLNYNSRMLGGGMSSIIENFTSMSTPNEVKFSYEDLVEGVTQRIDCINLPFLGSISNCKLSNCKINPRSYSGFLCSLISGQNRRDAFSLSYYLANKTCAFLKTRKISSSDI
jgi:hypothetical protein